MKHNSISARSLIILVVSIICLVGSAAAAAGQTRPFKGRIDGQFVATPTANPILFRSVATAQGNATHVGRFTKVTSDTFNLATGEVTGGFTMTTANGGLLTGQYSGFVVSAATTFSWLLNATITGGTGRFTNASGQFVFEAQGDYYFTGGNLEGTYSETFNGTISY